MRSLTFFSYQFVIIVQEPAASFSRNAEEDDVDVDDDDDKEKENSKASIGNIK